MTDFTNVSTRAMLASLRVSMWSARKFDRRVSDEVNEEKQADKDAGRFNKHLLAGALAHKAVITAGLGLRDIHYRETLPWADEGWRLLPTTNYLRYVDQMRRARGAFDRAIDEFVNEYPALQQQAVARLGALYHAEEFPSARDVRQRFGSAIEFGPVPSAGDIRVELPADHLAQIEHQITQRVEQATKDAMQGAWDRLHEAVLRIRKASSKDGIVRGNLIEHARETCDLLVRLNVAQDERLDAVRQRVERELTVLSVEDLRKDDRLRDDTARRAGEIIAAMQGFYTPVAQEVA
jgi:hypothetical protein